MSFTSCSDTFKVSVNVWWHRLPVFLDWSAYASEYGRREQCSSKAQEIPVCDVDCLSASSHDIGPLPSGLVEVRCCQLFDVDTQDSSMAGRLLAMCWTYDTQFITSDTHHEGTGA
jgi:hypothetical protein